MTGKIFLILNILLLLLFGYKLFNLSGTIRYKGEKKFTKISYDFIEIKRPTYKIDKEYRNIFGLKPLVPDEKRSSQRDKGGPQDELHTGDLTLRVKGIFIADDLEYAIISLFNKKTRKSEEKKVGLGDKINDLSIIDILPGYVSLMNDSEEELTLRIFKQK